MNTERIIEQLHSHLVSGERRSARKFVRALYSAGASAETLAKEVFWPLLEMTSTLFRKDQMTTLAHQYSTRMLRMFVDQAQERYEEKALRGRSICVFCGPNETEELAGQMVADLLEADGYEVTFAGGGVANDDISEELAARQPDVLLMFASSAKDAPMIRELIDSIREKNAHPAMQIVVGGGIFNRAPGLDEEIGADTSAKGPADLLKTLLTQKNVRNERWAKKLRVRAAA
ncbi:MAG: cobalamin B12-binding domain-containing protein [Planctomycetota bacterium]|jgi:methanogenic corrinoid protein MtbC1|nr:MAG: cobalamin B12-binding domain-containing protein [Planctomycetota bacterium]RLS91224.1 MAG: cobalamin B12-binding domain-containing protein [Planctomycetota bacterium]